MKWRGGEEREGREEEAIEGRKWECTKKLP